MSAERMLLSDWTDQLAEYSLLVERNLWAERYPTAIERYCWIHGWEVILKPEKHYRRCGECNHTFVTGMALLNEHRLERGQINLTRMRTGGELLPTEASAADVAYCPLCGTDWGTP